MSISQSTINFEVNKGSSYTHLLTGAVSFAEPNETGGGILADDMGLGKSLTVLSNIVATLDKAKTFANAEEMTSADENRPNCTASIMVSRATLIVVPSPCKFCFDFSDACKQ